MAASREPQNVSRATWYYEFSSHLLIVHEAHDKSGRYIQTDQFKLPWRLIEQSQKRRAERADSKASA